MTSKQKVKRRRKAQGCTCEKVSAAAFSCSPALPVLFSPCSSAGKLKRLFCLTSRDVQVGNIWAQLLRRSTCFRDAETQRYRRFDSETRPCPHSLIETRIDGCARFQSTDLSSGLTCASVPGINSAHNMLLIPPRSLYSEHAEGETRDRPSRACTVNLSSTGAQVSYWLLFATEIGEHHHGTDAHGS